MKSRIMETQHLHRRHQAVHMVAAVAIIAEEEFVVVLRGSAQSARLTLDALPGVLLHTDLHVVRELQARCVAWTMRLNERLEDTD